MKMITSSVLIITIALLSTQISAEATSNLQDDDAHSDQEYAADAPENEVNEDVTPDYVADAPEIPAAPPTTEEIAGGVCAGCHSADGNSIIPVNPNLAGQHAVYITKQLIDFKSIDGETPKRNSPVMTAMVAALTEENMQELGIYYAQQKAKPITVSDDEDLMALGKILYHGGNIDSNVPACASCHGPTGSGIPPHYPSLAGQHASYTFTQLTQFDSGERANDNGIMQKVLARMSAQEKRAVSEYISSLR
ncbi:MAG: cytochrome c4 [Nitrosomonas sp.]|nr:cytochrome c4 [Nitrosomonas sp.]